MLSKPTTSDTAFCKISYDKTLNAVLCTWKKFCQGDDYRNPLRHGLKLLKETGCKNWITDTANGFESTPEDTQWLLETFIPETLSTHCKNLFFIIAPDSPLQGEISAQAEALKELFNVRLCKDLDTVRSILTADKLQ